jgi:hypothetical protein
MVLAFDGQVRDLPRGGCLGSIPVIMRSLPWLSSTMSLILVGFFFHPIPSALSILATPKVIVTPEAVSKHCYQTLRAAEACN